MFKSRFLPVLIFALIAIGAIASLWMVLRTGRNNQSILLITLFAGWVLSPFAALLLASLAAKRWAMATRTALYCLVVLITAGSLLVYSGVLIPGGSKPAAVFLIAPLLSWPAMVIVIPVTTYLSRRKAKTTNDERFFWRSFPEPADVLRGDNFSVSTMSANF